MCTRLSFRTRMALLLVSVVAGLALTAGLLNGLHAMSAEAQAAPSAESAPSGTLATSAGPAAPMQPLQQCHVITFQQGVDDYIGCRDTRITAERPNDNYCNDELVLGMKGDGRVLVQFLDLERSIPTNARIVNGTLGLYVYNYGQRTRPISVAAYPVIRPWKECEATWNKAVVTTRRATVRQLPSTRPHSMTTISGMSGMSRGRSGTGWRIHCTTEGWF
jgi:hypothetical protein